MKMNQMKKCFLIILAASLGMSLAACGSPDNGDDIIAGDDWRTTGVVVGSGTITHEGEGSVDVLVTIDPDSAAFYRDTPDQVLFDSVSFPMTISDARESFNDISFDDINGDGESDVCVSFVHAPGESTQLVWIWDSEERYVFREDLSTDTASSGDVSEYTGLWEYVGENLWLRIYDDATWELLNEQEEVIEYGTLWTDFESVTLHFDGSGDVLQLDRTVSGDLIDSANNGLLVPVEAIQPSQSGEDYFTANGLFYNAATNNGTYLLENGASSYADGGDGYITRDCYWEIIKNSDDAHDGIREIQFDAICYIPKSSNSYSNQEAYVVTSSDLYDRYTGIQFSEATTYDNSTRGENYHLHTIDWNGQSEIIEFYYSTDWQNDVGDWSKVLTKSYVVYLPDGYDGLVFAAETQPDNYADCARRLQADSSSSETYMMDVDDPFNSLYFDICA